jgi:hypothetical protein
MEVLSLAFISHPDVQSGIKRLQLSKSLALRGIPSGSEIVYLFSILCLSLDFLIILFITSKNTSPGWAV